MPEKFTNFNKLLPPYWSRQHGAYITLISAWLIAILITSFNRLQIIAIFFLLSGLNLVELLSEKFFRKSVMPARKLFWLRVYLFVTIVSGVALFLFAPDFLIVFAALSLGAFFYLLLFKSRLHKHILSEWLIFALLSIAAFIGSSFISWREIFPAVLVMTLFFGSSVFAVKERFGRIHVWPVIIYVLVSTIFILFGTHFSMFGFLTSILLLLKTSGSWGYPEKYHKLPIKSIGILESVFQLCFVLNFYFFFEKYSSTI
jgi:hypothetical protein